MTLYPITHMVGFSTQDTAHLTWAKPVNVPHNLTYQYKIDSGSWITMGSDNTLLKAYPGVYAYLVDNLSSSSSHTFYVRATDTPNISTEVSINLISDNAVDLGSGKVALPVTDSNFIPGQRVSITGTLKYDGKHTLLPDTDSTQIVIAHVYTEETFNSTQTIEDADIASTTVTTKDSDSSLLTAETMYRGLDQTFTTNTESFLYKIVTIFSAYLKDFYTEFTDKVLTQYSILSATLTNLDFFGNLFGMRRVHTETDEDFRTRLIGDMLKERNTMKSIKDSVQRYSSSPVLLVEGSLTSTPGTDGATFCIYYSPMPDTSLTRDIVNDIVNNLKTAGTVCAVNIDA